MSVINTIREKLKKGEYEFTTHFLEEMANDDLSFDDIKIAILKGKRNKTFTNDPIGPRYKIVGYAIDGRPIAVICRNRSTGMLLLITVYVLR